MSYMEHNEPKGGTSNRTLFGRATLPELIQRNLSGFHQTRGFHIYCELRPTAALHFAESDSKALKYVKVIEEFVNHGVQAASPFKVLLLELQGNVLHFYKESELNLDSAIEAIQFVFLFTTTLYDELKPELGDDWQGFASCIDHGDAIIIGHNSIGCSSAVSLGPVANRPAKQLLYGKTSAGCVDVPTAWAKALGGTARGEWFTINLRDREQFPFVSRMENAALREQLLARVRAFRRDRNRARIIAVDKAHRIQRSCVHAALNG